MDWLKTILSSLKEFVANPILYLAAMLVSACLMFLPVKLLDAIKLNGIATRYAEWIGLIFLVSLVTVMIAAGSKIWKCCKVKLLLKSMEKSLLDLFPRERAIIIKMYSSPDRSIRLHYHYDNASIAVLLNMKIIQRANNLVNIVDGDSYFLQPWVCWYLDKHPEYISDELKKRDD